MLLDQDLSTGHCAMVVLECHCHWLPLTSESYTTPGGVWLVLVVTDMGGQHHAVQVDWDITQIINPGILDKEV